MDPERFEHIVAEEFPNAVPEKFRKLLQNVAVLTEGEPSEDVRREERLREDETLLGLYRGVPATARGDLYGVGSVLPDTIVLYQHPIEDEAAFLCQGSEALFEEKVRQVVRETIWHEIAHHFGFSEEQVRKRREERNT